MSILCVGELVADIIVGAIPNVEKLPDSVIVDEIRIANGGDALNTAVGLGRLGNQVFFVGKAGNDAFGQQLIDIAKQSGVNTDYVRFSEKCANSKVVALIYADGSRHFLHCPGSNEEFSREDIDLAVMLRCKHLHIGGTFHLPSFDGFGAMNALQQAQSLGLTTSMDVCYDHSGRWLELIRCCLPYLDYFMPSIDEARVMLGIDNVSQLAKEFQLLGAKNIIIKMGEAGSFCCPEQGLPFIHGCYHVDVVDTTGAGDAFVAGLLSGLDDGCTLEQSVLRGTANAAFAVQAMGATTGIGDLNTMLHFINSTDKPAIIYGA